MDLTPVRNIARVEALAAHGEYYLSDVLSTTNATPTVLQTLDIEDGTAGVLSIVVIGLHESAASAITKELRISYRKVAGGLTLLENVVFLEDEFTGATVLVQNDGSNNIEIEVTGVAATVINWQSKLTILIKQTATATP